MSRQRVYLEARASVSFHSGNLDPLDVTRVLLLPPDNIHRSGEPKLSRTKTGKVIKRGEWRSGLWGMSSERWVESPRVETHIEWVLQELEPKADQVRDILEHAHGRIFCYTCGYSPNAPSYPSEFDQRAAALGLTIEIDHYEMAEGEEV